MIQSVDDYCFLPQTSNDDTKFRITNLQLAGFGFILLLSLESMTLHDRES